MTPPSRSPRGYTPLFERVVASNAILLVAACLVTILVLAPRKISSFAADEAIVLAAALALVALINVVLVRRAVAPLQAVNALARRVDLSRPASASPAPSRPPRPGAGVDVQRDARAASRSSGATATRRVLAAQEGERLRIARELHDEIGQTLTAVLLQLGRGAQARCPRRCRRELHEAQEAARESLEERSPDRARAAPRGARRPRARAARWRLWRALRPARGAARSSQRARPRPARRSAARRSSSIYRVAQEALTNVARHAGADGVELRAGRDGRRAHAARPRRRPRASTRRRDGGGGVRGMRERAVLVGAELTIARAGHGGGTEVRLDVPLAEERA